MATNNQSQTCAECEYMVRSQDRSFCRRYPPTPNVLFTVQGPVTIGAWPPVQPEQGDRCGEFRKKAILTPVEFPRNPPPPGPGGLR